jgi:hypothetical protein
MTVDTSDCVPSAPFQGVIHTTVPPFILHTATAIVVSIHIQLHEECQGVKMINGLARCIMHGTQTWERGFRVGNTETSIEKRGPGYVLFDDQRDRRYRRDNVLDLSLLGELGEI